MILISFIKKIFGFIKIQRKNILIIFFLTFLIILIRFPWSEGTEKVIRQIKSQIKLPIDVDFKKVSINLIPPSFSFYDLQIDNKFFDDTLNLEKLKFSLSLKKWLALNPGYKVNIKKDDSQLFLTYWTQKKKANKKKETYYYFEGFSSLLNLEHLMPLSEHIKADGITQFNFALSLNTENLETLSGLFSVEASNIKFYKFQIVTPMGPLSFPNIRWKRAEIKMRISEGEVIFDTVQLGTSQDALFIQLRGSLSLSFPLQRRVRVDAYDLQVQIETSQNFRSDLLDLMLSNTKTQTLKGYRYRARIQGGGSEPARIERLSVF